MIKSPCRYFGGKSNMLNDITKHFPEPKTYNTFIDAFGGSGCLLLSQPVCGKLEIYNDIYENVYSIFKCISDKTLFLSFKEKCDLSLYSSQLRKEYIEKLKEDSLSIVDRAYYFWYVNRTSHNGSGGFSVNSSIRRGMSKSTSDFLSCIERLPNLHDRLSSVIIENKDALELIKKYNSNSTFIYLDPPYHHDSRGSARYKCDYSNEQHEALIDTVLKSNSKILISGYICEAYKRLEPVFSRIDFEVKTVDGNFNKRTKIESLWKNY